MELLSHRGKRKGVQGKCAFKFGEKSEFEEEKSLLELEVRESQCDLSDVPNKQPLKQCHQKLEQVYQLSEQEISALDLLLLPPFYEASSPS